MWISLTSSPISVLNIESQRWDVSFIKQVFVEILVLGSGRSVLEHKHIRSESAFCVGSL